jgi:2-phospho-L-lactate guanylyltransferase (CobY/MobA/RfbA family)
MTNAKNTLAVQKFFKSLEADHDCGSYFPTFLARVVTLEPGVEMTDLPLAAIQKIFDKFEDMCSRADSNSGRNVLMDSTIEGMAKFDDEFFAEHLKTAEGRAILEDIGINVEIAELLNSVQD